MKSAVYSSNNDKPVKNSPLGGDIQVATIRIITNVGTGQR